METRHLLVLCAVLGLVAAGKHDIYASNSVHGVQLRNKADQEYIHLLEVQMDLDIWQEGVAGRRVAQVMVTPDKKAAFLKALDDKGIQHYVHLEDVAKAFTDYDHQVEMWRSMRKLRMIFQDYPRYAEVDAYLERVASQHPNIAKLVTAGKSYEGRDIKYLKISTTNFEDASKPVYILTTMIHAREWVTTPVALYSIYRLVENLRSQDQDLLRDIDWIIMPLVNPDGYEYTHTNERLWRKTRTKNVTNHETCVGVDGNRNFDMNFASLGVSNDPCHLTYPGPFPFSEAETRYIRDIFHEYLGRIQLFMDVHSFGNYVTFGYGDETLPQNAPQVLQVAAAMGAVIDTRKLPEADFYLIGNSATLMYVTSGCAQDYGTSIGIPFSYTLELPSYGYDFRVPPQYVDQINEETWHGIAISARLARVYYTARRNAQNNS
ncbi:hypothetical protein B5X24_HaOG210092 [Helicoverpa armigera]|nr:hypothetical protein B5X24_HaOG210092 [Helicoverpa armigera]